MSNQTATPPIVVCGSCLTRNYATNETCVNCKLPLEAAKPAGAAQSQMAFPGTESGQLVRGVAWLVLALGMIGAMYIYSEYSTIEVPGAFGGTTLHSNPMAGWIAAAVAVQAFVSCIALLALGAAAENSAEIRRVLAKMSKE